jgi:hypothetical protein
VSFDYTRSAATSLRMLAKFGQSVTRRAVTVGGYNTATGAATVTTADTTRTGVILDYNQQSRQSQSYAGESLVLAGDRRLLLDAEGPVLMSDRFVVQSVEYSVVSIGETNPAGTPVLYDIQIRRS